MAGVLQAGAPFSWDMWGGRPACARSVVKSGVPFSPPFQTKTRQGSGGIINHFLCRNTSATVLWNEPPSPFNLSFPTLLITRVGVSHYKGGINLNLQS